MPAMIMHEKLQEIIQNVLQIEFQTQISNLELYIQFLFLEHSLLHAGPHFSSGRGLPSPSSELQRVREADAEEGAVQHSVRSVQAQGWWTGDSITNTLKVYWLFWPFFKIGEKDFY